MSCISGRAGNSLRQFLAWARARPPPEVLHTERKFDLTCGGSEVDRTVDRMDRIGEIAVAIVDYKTGKPRTQEDADESLQLSLYALAAKEAWGERADRLIFHNLEDNYPCVTTRNDAQSGRGEDARARKRRRISRRGNFPPKPGFHCTFCPYRNLCPATEKVVQSAEENQHCAGHTSGVDGLRHARAHAHPA